MINVAITDDQAIIINGLQKILADAPHINIVGVFSNGDDLLAFLTTNQPDILLLDIQMPGKTGLELSAIISKTYKQIKMIALTNIDVLAQVKKMLQNGCTGYLLKDASPAVIVKAIEMVYEGEQFLQEEIQKQLLNSLTDPKPSHLITRREKEILQLIAQEFTNQEIATQLFLSLRTVENHRNSLLHKLGVKNTAGLVREAISQGLV